MKIAYWLLSAAFFAGMACSTSAVAATKISPGNINLEQPNIPGASKNRTRALKKTFEGKYEKVVRLLKSDRRLIADIKQVSQRFGIDPIHMVGAIVGEHTYNVDALDRAQSYYVKALSYVSSDISFEYEGERVTDFVQRTQFEPCSKLETSLSLWSCRERIWNSEFRGKKVDGTAFPNDRFSAIFFQPFYAGQTFGIGQLNPLTALMMTDKVNKVTGARKISANSGKDVYATIMDPRKTLPYIAATLAASIDAYKKYAGYDISENPGITSTLYNTGNAIERAKVLGSKNKKLEAQGKKRLIPEENYYGWLINDREDELRSLL